MKILGFVYVAGISANDKTLFKWDVGNVDQEFCQSTFDSYAKKVQFDQEGTYKSTKKDASQVKLYFHQIIW